MKKIVFSALFALICLQPVSTQRPNRQRQAPTPETIVNRMNKQLSLTEEQQKELLKLYENHFKEMKEKKEKTSREERQTMREDFQKKIKAVLTEEQVKKMEELNQKKQNRKKGKNQ